ncbi:aldehyde dehydrogenase family protein [Pseudomonas sp. HT11]|uniref:aldehyde dehydrogenase family protein n=1 Tax=Pseudomonas sp. HT11 TaxID=3230490 RepID=UPI00384DE558
MPYDDQDEALTIANDTPYGLQAYILSSALQRGFAHRRRSRVDRYPWPTSR